MPCNLRNFESDNSSVCCRNLLDMRSSEETNRYPYRNKNMLMNTITSNRSSSAFCCHYCAYAAADLAGSGRLQYPPNIRIIRSPCTGRLEVDFFMKAFESGVDGVLIAGCEEGSCHFQEGNLPGETPRQYGQTALTRSRSRPGAIAYGQCQRRQFHKFAQDVRDMVETVRKLGPARDTKTPATEHTGARS